MEAPMYHYTQTLTYGLSVLRIRNITRSYFFVYWLSNRTIRHDKNQTRLPERLYNRPNKVYSIDTKKNKS